MENKENPPIDELVIVYLEDGLKTVGKWSGLNWTILHEIYNTDPISFGEVTPLDWCLIPNKK